MKTLNLLATLLLTSLSLFACESEATPSSEVTYPEAITQAQLAVAKANGITYYGKKWQISDDMKGALLKCDNIPDTRRQVVCNGVQPDFGGTFITTKVLCKYDAKQDCITKD